MNGAVRRGWLIGPHQHPLIHHHELWARCRSAAFQTGSANKAQTRCYYGTVLPLPHSPLLAHIRGVYRRAFLDAFTELVVFFLLM